MCIKAGTELYPDTAAGASAKLQSYSHYLILFVFARDKDDDIRQAAVVIQELHTCKQM